MKEVNVPNGLTLVRLIIGPIISYFIWSSQNIIALGLFLFALITDLADGYIARNYEQGTDFGKKFDAVTDKLMMGIVVLSLFYVNGFNFWLWFYLLVGGIGYIVSFYYFAKKEMTVSKFGRVFIVLESILIAVMIFGFVNDYIITLLTILLAIPGIKYIIEMKKWKI